jgi:hypothetical protein
MPATEKSAPPPSWIKRRVSERLSLRHTRKRSSGTWGPDDYDVIDSSGRALGRSAHCPRFRVQAIVRAVSTGRQYPNIQRASASIANSVIHASTRWPSRSILSMVVPESDANETGPPRDDPVREEHERFATTEGELEGPVGGLCRFTHHAPFHTKSTLGRICTLLQGIP